MKKTSHAHIFFSGIERLIRSRTMRLTRRHLLVVMAMAMAMAILPPCAVSLSLSSFSTFHGTPVGGWQQLQPATSSARARISSGVASLCMRKQKASDRRTRRLQRGGEELTQDLIRESLQSTITSSPMELVGAWNQKQQQQGGGFPSQTQKTGGRGRSRKRATLYNSLSSYHNKFFTLLTAEYQAEVRSKKRGIGGRFAAFPYRILEIPSTRWIHPCHLWGCFSSFSTFI